MSPGADPADGLYRDEAPMCGYDGCWALLLHGQWVPRPGYDDEDLEPHEHYAKTGEAG